MRIYCVCGHTIEMHQPGEELLGGWACLSCACADYRVRLSE